LNRHITEVLRARLNAQIELLEGSLLRGKAKDYEEYRYIVGKLDGLRIAQRELAEADSESNDED